MASLRNLCLCMLGICLLCASCSTYQPVKNVWKSTKGLWNTYVSTPASVDYEDKSSYSPQSAALANSVKGIDEELMRLERAMQNADKPPTQAWLDNLFASFPWLNGFAGIKYDGTILGQQPADSMKDLDFNPLLYEDKKQGSRALRADIQPSPLGPEIMLATPLYDGVDFLGIVVAYFDMRSLMHFSSNPQDMVILSPGALLWPGKYDFAATPLAGVDWAKAVAESHAGVCSNSNGSFSYLVRYLGNLPLVFAIPEKGNFPEGDGNLEQAAAFFPQSREKMPPPPLPERKPERESSMADFARRESDELEESVEAAEAGAQPEEAQASGKPSNEIEPGSRDSVLLKSGQARRRQVEERPLEGENVPVERVQRPRRQAVPIIMEAPQEARPEPQPQVRMPSPFGPEEKEPEPKAREFVPPSPFGPPESASHPAQEAAPEPAPRGAEPEAAPTVESAPGVEKDAAESGASETGSAPARMPDGRPSPFGPPDAN